MRAVLIITLTISMVASAAARANSTTASVRDWLFALPVVHCFPGLIGSNFFADSFSQTAAKSSIPMNPIPFSPRYFKSSPMFGSQEVLAKTGSSGSIHIMLGAYDDQRREAALNDGYYEYAEFVLLGQMKEAPAALHRRALHLHVGDGIGIGTQKADVDEFFGYGPGRPAKMTGRCGMVAEGFQTPQNGASAAYSFVFKDDEVVAIDFGAGS